MRGPARGVLTGHPFTRDGRTLLDVDTTNETYETLELSADAGLTLAVQTAEAGSASQDALDILSGGAAPAAAATAPGA